MVFIRITDSITHFTESASFVSDNKDTANALSVFCLKAQSCLL